MFTVFALFRCYSGVFAKKLSVYKSSSWNRNDYPTVRHIRVCSIFFGNFHKFSDVFDKIRNSGFFSSAVGKIAL